MTTRSAVDPAGPTPPGTPSEPPPGAPVDPAPVDPAPPPQQPPRPTGGAGMSVAVLAAVVGIGLGVAAALSVSRGSALPALFAVPYVAFLVAVWRLTRGNVAILVVAAYLVAPPPADNLMPQGYIFDPTDLGLTLRDIGLLADVVLLGALVTLRPALPAGAHRTLARGYLGCLALLAVFPLLVGLVAGVGQTLPALVQGAVMPTRGIALIVLLAWWARTRGWDSTVRDIGRTVVLCGVVLALVALTFVLLARGEADVTLLGYTAVVDGRPSVPGWGNNILGNFLATCCAALVFLRHRLGWRTRWVVLAAAGLLIGIVLTELRIAMLLALAIVEAPMVLAVVRRLWRSSGSLVAIPGGALAGAGLALVTVVVLPLLNPRFLTLAPAPLRPYLSGFDLFGFGGGGGTATTSTGYVVDAATGQDLGGRSLDTRGGLVQAALDVWQRNPLLGTGWNGWGWAKRDAEVSQLVAVDPHNGIAWLLADAGLLGVFLLYAVPVLLAVRRWDLWWLWAVPACATALEMVNPMLRNAHFSVVVWAFLALAFAAAPKQGRYGLGRFTVEAWDWVRGRPPRPPRATAPRRAAPRVRAGTPATDTISG